jgi:large subunit ribosomal protein L18
VILSKKQRRIRRARQTKIRIYARQMIRLSVFRTNCHIYATLFSGERVLATASTLDLEVRQKFLLENKSLRSGGNVAAAALIGQRIAEKAKEIGVNLVVFDRAGFAYHGRVKALAESAREAGLQF